jgi:hypothetical protein
MSMSSSSPLLSPLRASGPSKVESFCGHAYFYDGLIAFCELGIADLLRDDRPQTASEIAQSQGWNASRLYRLMRQMSFADVLAVKREATAEDDAASVTEFALTDDGRLFRSSHPSKCRSMLLLTHAPMIRFAMGECAAIIREPSAQYTRGDVRYICTQTPDGKPQNPFLFMQQPAQAAQGRIFMEAMSAYSSQEAHGILSQYTALATFHTVIDVGGGFGTLGCLIAKQHPTVASVIIADLAPVMASAKQRNEAAVHGVSDRVTFVDIDFLDVAKLKPLTDSALRAIEGGGRCCLLLKHVLHDWDDESALKILRNLHSIVEEVDGAAALVTLAIIEEHFPARDPSLPSQASDWYVSTMDVLMMSVTGGKQRDKGEWERLFAQSGWKWKSLIPCRINEAQLRAVSVLEAEII